MYSKKEVDLEVLLEFFGEDFLKKETCTVLEDPDLVKGNHESMSVDTDSFITTALSGIIVVKSVLIMSLFLGVTLVLKSHCIVVQKMLLPWEKLLPAQFELFLFSVKVIN